MPAERLTFSSKPDTTVEREQIPLEVRRALANTFGIKQDLIDPLGYSTPRFISHTPHAAEVGDQPINDWHDQLSTNARAATMPPGWYAVRGDLALQDDGTARLVTVPVHGHTPVAFNLGEVTPETAKTIRDSQGTHVGLVVQLANEMHFEGTDLSASTVPSARVDALPWIMVPPQNPDMKQLPEGAIVGLTGLVTAIGEKRATQTVTIRNGGNATTLLLNATTPYDGPIGQGVRTTASVSQDGFYVGNNQIVPLSELQADNNRQQEVRVRIEGGIDELSQALRAAQSIDVNLATADTHFAVARMKYAALRRLPLTTFDRQRIATASEFFPPEHKPLTIRDRQAVNAVDQYLASVPMQRHPLLESKIATEAAEILSGLAQVEADIPLATGEVIPVPMQEILRIVKEQWPDKADDFLNQVIILRMNQIIADPPKPEHSKTAGRILGELVQTLEKANNPVATTQLFGMAVLGINTASRGADGSLQLTTLLDTSLAALDVATGAYTSNPANSEHIRHEVETVKKWISLLPQDSQAREYAIKISALWQRMNYAEHTVGKGELYGKNRKS